MKKISSLLIGVLLIFSTFVIVNPVSAATITVNAGDSIQAAINSASPGDTIQIAAGSFTESITITKSLTIKGSGTATVITNNVHVVTVSASDVTIRDLTIKPVGCYGINIGNANNVNIINVEVTGNTLAYTENEVGLKVATTAHVTNLYVEGCKFNYCDYGWYIAKNLSDTSNLQYVKVYNTEFMNNDFKGLYIEKLSDAVFKDVKIYNNGTKDFWNMAWNGGMDINLKGMDYRNLTLENLDVRGNGLGYKEGAGVMIKARDDAPSYSSDPATLTNVNIIGGAITGNERGLRLGEPYKNNATPCNVVITNTKIYNNSKVYTGNDGSTYGDIVNHVLCKYTRTQRSYLPMDKILKLLKKEK